MPPTDNPDTPATAATEALTPFAAMFGFVPAETTARDDQATLQYGQKKVVLNPGEYANLTQAAANEGDKIGLDVYQQNTLVNYSKDGNVISGAEPVEAGGYYIATTRHDDKG